MMDVMGYCEYRCPTPPKLYKEVESMFYSEDWHFDKPKKTGQYLCLLDMGDICGQHNYKWEPLDFFKEGEDAGAEYADKHNFWARLYDETWEWIEVKNVVAWQYLTFPAEFCIGYIPRDGVDG